MAKNDNAAKQFVTDKLLELFNGTSVVSDKKIYTNIEVDGEIVQICIALTAPKKKIDISSTESFGVLDGNETIEEVEQTAKEMLNIIDMEE